MDIKKVFLGIGLFSALTLHPHTAQSHGIFEKGHSLYGGVAAGYSHMKTDVKEDFHIPGLALLQNQTRSSKKGSNSFVGDVFAGYRYIFENCFLAGLDLAFSFNKHDNCHTFGIDNFESRTTVKNKFKFIPGLIVGMIFMDKLIASVKLGASISRFKVNNKLVTPGVGANREDSFGKTKVGFFTSLNLEYALTNAWSALTSISYEHFGRFSNELTKVGVAVGESRSLKIEPSNYAVKAGLIYRFDMNS